MITMDSIREDFMTLWQTLGLSTWKFDHLERAFAGFAFEIVRYQTQDDVSSEDRDRAWSLLETMQVQYDAIMGYRAGENIIKIIKNHTQ